MTYDLVACQSFAGGFDLGAVRAGFRLVHKVEQVGGFGLPSCLANRRLLGDTWGSQACAPEAWDARPAHVLISNPPCSGFSVLTSRTQPGAHGIDANVNACMRATFAYAARVRPYVVVMESVRAAFQLGRPLMLALRDQLEGASGLRYDLWHVMHNALELGGAGQRPRYFLVASRVPFGVGWPRVRRPVLRDIIGDLEGLATTTWEPQPYRRPATWWSAGARSPSGVVDGHVTVRAASTDRALDLLELCGEWPGGWDLGEVARLCFTKTGRLPTSWPARWRGEDGGSTLEQGFRTMRRWFADRPARVVTGATLTTALHPTEARTLTHREVARVMGFPDDWRVAPLRRTPGLQPTWGKGITVQCGEWVAGWARAALDSQPGPDRGQLIGDREWLVQPSPLRVSVPALEAETLTQQTV